MAKFLVHVGADRSHAEFPEEFAAAGSTAAEIVKERGFPSFAAEIADDVNSAKRRKIEPIISSLCTIV